MFNEIDKTIFPDSCEVLEIVPQQHYVLPIFKCGKSSLYKTATAKGWKTLANEEINQVNSSIQIFLRDPKKRFISGVNTYLQHIKRDRPELDEKTVLWFVDNYLFLNRHYCPQFFWVLNLSRYINPTVKLRFDDYRNLSTITHINSDAGIVPPSTEFLDCIEHFNWKQLELYFYLDQLLIDCIGQELTFSKVLDVVHQQPDLYRLIFKRSIQLVNNVLPKT